MEKNIQDNKISVQDINYKKPEVLGKLIDKRFRIKKREETGLSGTEHRLAVKEIKKARLMGLLPFTDAHALV